MAKLREANALELSSARAVVLETTGNISVLYGDHMDEALFRRIAEPDDTHFNLGKWQQCRVRDEKLNIICRL